MQTKSAARNIFYGGSLFFLIIFFGLTAQSHNFIVNKSTDSAGITDKVRLGKKVWEDKACVNCHTIMGEGAYFAPELGNVAIRRGDKDDPKAFNEFLAEWMKAMPTKAEGRRQMPQFNLSDEEVDGLAEFFKWVGKIKTTDNWPPNEAG